MASRVQVNIVDVNDNPAVFDPMNYTVEIPEHSSGPVTTVYATDVDQVSLLTKTARPNSIGIDNMFALLSFLIGFFKEARNNYIKK